MTDPKRITAAQELTNIVREQLKANDKNWAKIIGKSEDNKKENQSIKRSYPEESAQLIKEAKGYSAGLKEASEKVKDILRAPNEYNTIKDHSGNGLYASCPWIEIAKDMTDDEQKDNVFIYITMMPNTQKKDDFMYVCLMIKASKENISEQTVKDLSQCADDIAKALKVDDKYKNVELKIIDQRNYKDCTIAAFVWQENDNDMESNLKNLDELEAYYNRFLEIQKK